MADENSKDMQPIEGIVKITENRMFTTSLIIAEAFEKNHYDVLKAIGNMECSEEFNERNFTAVEYKDAKGEMRPAYEITRDGFAFLAMGFTGRKAAAWKEKFLEAFNAMERELLQSQGQKMLEVMERLPRIPDVKEDPGEQRRKFIAALAAYWAFVDGLSLEQTKNILCAYLKVSRFEGIGGDEYGDAVNFLLRVSHTPGHNDRPASPEHIEIAHTLMDACTAFKYTRNSNFEQVLQDFCGIDMAGIDDLTESGVNKVIMAAWNFLNHAWRYAEEMCNLEKLGLLLNKEEVN